MLLNFKS